MGSESDNARGPFDHQHYVPCLRWKLGEYQALMRLTARTKGRITPLIEVPEIGWDFERKVEAKTLDQHLAPFAKRVQAKWQDRVCLVDLGLLGAAARMADGNHPVNFIFHELRSRGCSAIPVTGLQRDADYQKAVCQVASRDGYGVCLRVALSQAARTDVGTTVGSLVQALGVDMEQTDLVVDLDAPNFVPLGGFSRLVQSVVLRLPKLDKWRTFTLIGTSFPPTMAGLSRGAQRLVRQEWLLYGQLVGSLQQQGRRLPTFGDYGIAHPDVLQLDMRIVKPAASIRYTVDNAWYIIKGPNVRDHGFVQYRRLCRDLVSSRFFASRGFSAGDAYIEGCANGIKSTGNLTTWRWVGTNHHIEKVAVDVASLFA